MKQQLDYEIKEGNQIGTKSKNFGYDLTAEQLEMFNEEQITNLKTYENTGTIDKLGQQELIQQEREEELKSK